jgi:hypothetical protein
MLGKYEVRDVLSTLWIFVTVNYIFCDIFTLHYAPALKMFIEGKAGDMVISQQFLLIFAFILELAMLMIVLARYLPYRINRYFNIAIGAFMSFQQSATLTLGDNSMHYVFFSIIEVATTLSIVWLAFKWKGDKESPSAPVCQPEAIHLLYELT